MPEPGDEVSPEVGGEQPRDGQRGAEPECGSTRYGSHSKRIACPVPPCGQAGCGAHDQYWVGRDEEKQFGLTGMAEGQHAQHGCQTGADEEPGRGITAIEQSDPDKPGGQWEEEQDDRSNDGDSRHLG